MEHSKLAVMFLAVAFEGAAHSCFSHAAQQHSKRQGNFAVSRSQRPSFTAFAPSSPLPGGKRRAKTSAPPLGATVYYPDSEGEYGDGGDVLGFSCASSGGVLSQLAERLSRDPTNLPRLARLASAFSPPELSIDLGNINQVRCLAVDKSRLEIEAVVCDDLECSSLLVPVSFPQECDVNSDLESCVLENVDALDREGEQVMQQRQATFAEEKEAHEAYEVFQSLSQFSGPAPADFPYWWIPPSTSDDIAECDTIMQLLNGQDIVHMVRDLAARELRISGRGVDVVQQAQVLAIGPAGIILQVQVGLNGRSANDAGGLSNIEIVNLPLQFAPATGPRSIREEVLGMVSSVSSA